MTAARGGEGTEIMVTLHNFGPFRYVLYCHLLEEEEEEEEEEGTGVINRLWGVDRWLNKWVDMCIKEYRMDVFLWVCQC